MLIAYLRLQAPDIGQSGAALVEFALIAPVLVTLLGGATDLGRVIALSLQVEDASRTAAQYVTRAPNDAAGAQTAALAALSGTSGPNVVVGAMVCKCPPAGAATGGAVVSCTNITCATGIIQYVTVTASATFTPIFPASNLLAFNTLTGVSDSVTVRLH